MVNAMAEQRDMIGLPAEADARSLIGRDLGEVPESKWAPLLAQLVDVLEAMHLRQGRSEEDAFKLASDSTMEIAEYFGGRVVYLPRGERLKIALRDAEIHHRWQRGHQIATLAAEYVISDIHLYRVIRQQRALHIRKNQRELSFDNEGK